MNTTELNKKFDTFKGKQWKVQGWETMKFVDVTLDDNGVGMAVYKNNLYTCYLRVPKAVDGFIWLSIKCNSLKPAKNWQHFQQIKNDIVGEDSEAVELYPAMSRVIDTANQYHLWVLPDKKKFEFGFDEGMAFNKKQVK